MIYYRIERNWKLGSPLSLQLLILLLWWSTIELKGNPQAIQTVEVPEARMIYYRIESPYPQSNPHEYDDRDDLL